MNIQYLNHMSLTPIAYYVIALANSVISVVWKLVAGVHSFLNFRKQNGRV